MTALGLLTGMVQAYIFSVLAAVYIVGNLVADLQVDGSASTGIYHNARGDLSFSIAVAAAPHRPNYGKGSYKGTLWLQQEPPAE